MRIRMKIKMNHITRWKRVIKILPGMGLGSDENEFLLLILNLICSPKLMNGKWNGLPLSTPYSNILNMPIGVNKNFSLPWSCFMLVYHGST